MNKAAKALGSGMTLLAFCAAALMTATQAQAQAQQLSGDALIDALRSGGYVLVMRHASSSVPAPRGGRGGFGGGARGGGRGGPAGEPEREIDDDGIGMVTGIRFAFRTLAIPVGDTLTSPTLRAQQHVRHFGFGNVMVADELGTEAMQADAARAEWLAAKAAEPPRAGTNTVIVTHAPNIIGAFGIDAVDEAETLILRPGADGATIVGRLKYEDWVRLSLG